MSLAAMEDAVFDDVMEQIDFDSKAVCQIYAALQDKKVAAAMSKGKTLTGTQDVDLAEMKIQLVEEMQNIYLHTGRVWTLNASRC